MPDLDNKQTNSSSDSEDKTDDADAIACESDVEYLKDGADSGSSAGEILAFLKEHQTQISEWASEILIERYRTDPKIRERLSRWNDLRTGRASSASGSEELARTEIIERLSTLTARAVLEASDTLLISRVASVEQ